MPSTAKLSTTGRSQAVATPLGTRDLTEFSALPAYNLG